MHTFKKLKICKVESPAFAKYCLARGVDYIGVHVIDYKLNPEKKALCAFIRQQHGKAILLTKTKDLQQLKWLLTYYQPWAIQLHYPLTITEKDRTHQLAV